MFKKFEIPKKFGCTQQDFKKSKTAKVIKSQNECWKFEFPLPIEKKLMEFLEKKLINGK